MSTVAHVEEIQIERQTWWKNETPDLATKLGRKEFSRRLRIQAIMNDPHCHYCQHQINLDNSSIDHVLPVSKGGAWDEENLRVVCNECNREKDNQTPFQWLTSIMMQIGELQRKAELLAKAISEDGIDNWTIKKRLLLDTPQIDRRDFIEHGQRFSILDKSTGKRLISGLYLSDAVHFLRSVGGSEFILVEVTRLFHADLNLTLD